MFRSRIRRIYVWYVILTFREGLAKLPTCPEPTIRDDSIDYLDF